VQSTKPKNPQQPKGNNKRNKKKKFNTEKGTASTQNREGQKREEEDLVPLHNLLG
jgi:hypothetical protein